ncbi:hypothetical protein E6H18_08165 [Candidatus Bathyarchaeota archaeon]|nr:MAG: hypothetical protein E6H18_08165 [Candidatus Bathyarchaeota archaeon]
MRRSNTGIHPKSFTTSSRGNRDQSFSAEIVSPSHQGFQTGSFTGAGASKVTIASYPPIVQ